MRIEIGRSILIMVLMFMFGPASSHGVAAGTQESQTVTLAIDGMSCGACVKDVKAALAQVPGVSSVEILVGKRWVFFSDYSDARAWVTFDPQKAGVEALVKAVEAASSPLSAYKARVLPK